MLEKIVADPLLYFAVILFSLFYSRIQAASQSKKSLYFPYFGDFFPKPAVLLGCILKFKRHRLYPKKGNKITVLAINIYSRISGKGAHMYKCVGDSLS